MLEKNPESEALSALVQNFQQVEKEIPAFGLQLISHILSQK